MCYNRKRFYDREVTTWKRDHEGLKEQQERRKRINCMKMGIITSIFVWMLISIILCVVLLCRVISLQNQIDRLVSSGIVSGQVQQDENQSKGEMSTGTELQTDTEYQDQNADSSDCPVIGGRG